MSHDDIVNHFQATHEHFKPNVPRKVADDDAFGNVASKKSSVVAAADDDLSKDFERVKSDPLAREEGELFFVYVFMLLLLLLILNMC